MCIVPPRGKPHEGQCLPYSPCSTDLALRGTPPLPRPKPMKSPPKKSSPQPPAATDQVKRPARSRGGQRLKVGMTEAERAEIERRARMTGLSLSAYLVAAGMGLPIRSTYDYDAVRELAKVAGDLGRLGGLMKLWLAERRGEGAAVADVNRVLQDARKLQDEIRRRMARI